ncbi:MAG: histidinol-phosphate transaminase [Verrucomicrobiota bacterium]
MPNINRRHWLKLSGTGLLASASLAHQSLRGQETSSAPQSGYPYTNLSINENQFGPSPKVKAAIIKAATLSHEYPDIPRAALTQAIAQRNGLTKENILIGAGSADILYGAGYYFGLKNIEIVSADPSFHIMSMMAEKVGSNLKKVRHNAMHGIDLNALKDAVTDQTGLIYICNPENPTGALLPPAELRAFCIEMSEKCPIVVDEAYIDYAGDSAALSMIPLVKEGYPIVITRTFSKGFGLGGMRVGYAVATPELAKGVGSHYVTGIGCGASRLSIEAALAAYEDTTHIQTVEKQNAQARQHIMAILRDQGLEPIPSQGGFVLVPVPMNSKALADGILYSSQVKISPRNYYGQNYLRISTGRPDQLTQLEKGLKLVMKAA